MRALKPDITLSPTMSSQAFSPPRRLLRESNLRRKDPIGSQATNHHLRSPDLRRGIGATLDSESTLRSAATLLSWVRALPWRPGLSDGLKASDYLVVDWLY
ncbi:hypothetical protein PoB_003434500 [Plakobranchus ocellatus]|uniref:Uncharacterized protein n=1 Tax=Plakobranchus ocellatus TaxID=259542 RepID=A0AAV4AI44_9GAST|nr:hypothetical protein PoB_003434500 [Plakobranchus ocellatus]